MTYTSFNSRETRSLDQVCRSYGLTSEEQQEPSRLRKRPALGTPQGYGGSNVLGEASAVL